jgi:hypothetical protein
MGGQPSGTVTALACGHVISVLSRTLNARASMELRLVNLSKDDCRRSAGRRFSRFKRPRHGKFRQAGVASERCARPVVRSSWSPDGWRLCDCARETVRGFQFHSFDRETPARGPPWGRGLVCSFLSRGSAGPAFTSFRAGAQSRSSPRRQNPWAT